MRPSEQSGPGGMEEVLAKLDDLQRQMSGLAEARRRQEELFQEFAPVLKEVMATATSRLDGLEKQGYFAFGRELLGVAQRIVEGFGADDVRKFGDAVVSILETVRSMTQPEVLGIAGEASQVIQNAGEVEPMGILGMVRATHQVDVQRGMAVLMEVLKHVGRAAETMARQQATSPAARKRERLAQLTASRRPKVLGVERTPAPRAAPAKRDDLGPPAACAVPAAAEPVAATIDGIDFTAGGHLADPKQWTRELAVTLAAAEGLTLSDPHWKVLEFARGDFEKNGVSPNIRRLTQGTGLATKELYTLFPKAPGRTVAKLAGIPKPAGCI